MSSCCLFCRRRLDNYPYLVRKYCARRLDGSELPTLNQIKDAAPLSVSKEASKLQDKAGRLGSSAISWSFLQAAEVVCELYATLGTSFLPKLKGDFAFVCFDSKKVRQSLTLTGVAHTDSIAH